MNYQNIYDAIIEKFRNAVPHGYYEVHHTIPRCLGGGNEKENLVNLPARYHFVAHLCLAKIYKDKADGKLTIAAFLMSKDNKHGSREYEWLRTEYSKVRPSNMIGNTIMVGRKLSPECLAKKSILMMGNTYAFGNKGHPPWNKGKKMPDGFGEKVRIRVTGKKFTEEQRARCSAAQTGNTKGYGGKGKKRKPLSLDHKEKISYGMIKARELNPNWSTRKKNTETTQELT